MVKHTQKIRRQIATSENRDKMKDGLISNKAFLVKKLYFNKSYMTYIKITLIIILYSKVLFITPPKCLKSSNH